MYNKIFKNVDFTGHDIAVVTGWILKYYIVYGWSTVYNIGQNKLLNVTTNIYQKQAHTFSRALFCKKFVV